MMYSFHIKPAKSPQTFIGLIKEKKKDPMPKTYFQNCLKNSIQVSYFNICMNKSYNTIHSLKLIMNMFYSKIS